MNRATLAALAALAMAGCAQAAPSNYGNIGKGVDAETGRALLSPECRANLAAVRAIDVKIVRVPREVAYNHGSQAWVFATLETPLVFIRNDVSGWYEQDLLDHEKCHVWHYRTTGNAEFHK